MIFAAPCPFLGAAKIVISIKNCFEFSNSEFEKARPI